MNWINMSFAAYGVLLLVGGFLGYKAGSRQSLAAGIISGVLVLAGVYLLGIDKKAGFSLIAAVAVGLSMLFAIRFIKTNKIMPSGMLFILSALAATVSIIYRINS